jgi:hypothetical protein
MVRTWLSTISSLSQEATEELNMAFGLRRELEIVGADELFQFADNFPNALQRALDTAAIHLTKPGVDHHISFVIANQAANESIPWYTSQMQSNALIYILLTPDVRQEDILTWQPYQLPNFVTAKIGEDGGFYRLFPTQ